MKNIRLQVIHLTYLSTYLRTYVLTYVFTYLHLARTTLTLSEPSGSRFNCRIKKTMENIRLQVIHLPTYLHIKLPTYLRTYT